MNGAIVTGVFTVINTLLVIFLTKRTNEIKDRQDEIKKIARESADHLKDLH